MKWENLTIPLMAFSLIVCLAITPETQAQRIEKDQTFILHVTSYAYQQHLGNADWGDSGASPHLDAQDYPIAYISTGSLSRTRGNYTFQNLPRNAENVSSVLLYTYAGNLGAGGSNGSLNLHPWNGSMWDYAYHDYKIPLYQPDGWGLRYIDWATYGTVDNVTEVNDAELAISSATLWTSSPSLFVDYVYLNVTCDIAYPFSVVDEHTWTGIFLGGLAVMIWSPSWVAWKIKKKGIDDETIERIGYALIYWVIGFGLFMAWLYH